MTKHRVVGTHVPAESVVISGEDFDRLCRLADEAESLASALEDRDIEIEKLRILAGRTHEPTGKDCEQGHPRITYYGDECPFCIEMRADALMSRAKEIGRNARDDLPDPDPIF